tara:strand:- start:292 stop:537 length:246 start_codon:yes stop_codon:yes gene_type:complete
MSKSEYVLIDNETKIRLTCDIASYIFDEFAEHISESELIEHSSESTVENPMTRYTEIGQEIFESMYSEVETRILKYFKEIN